MGKITKFTVKKIHRSESPMSRTQKVKLTYKYADGEIDLSMCDLQDIPVKDIVIFKKAHSLDLSNNRLTLLPKNFVTLTHITKLDLSKNQLQELPDDFGELTKLKHLDLYKNSLQHLPISFSKLKALKWLDLKDNPLMPVIAKTAGPCLDIKQCQSCAKDIVGFYALMQQKIDEERELREARQQQKDITANELLPEKQKSAKKSKKEKKLKSMPRDGGNKVFEFPIEQEVKIATKTQEVKKSESSFLICCIKTFVTITILFCICVFILTALKLKETVIIEEKVVKAWKDGVANLPPSMHPAVAEISAYFEKFHVLVGQSLQCMTVYIGELYENEYVMCIVKNIVKSYDISINALSNLYQLIVSKK